ncbi:hypothetical protein BV25DRAFT_1920052 [Artomyces pyxidatus]|uniref:Uncharacterized protein n=1 Tax=Artomyces pyxidatus TaxID=48021 RepID=A0ACB8SNQ3_9AGAM|nr:hypothetical protein BV25DRAFT_1920052 [Artomyces pyxidatus]
MAPSLGALAHDVLLEILEDLDYKGLMSCQATCRRIRTVVASSVSLQYIIELAACGMLDGPRGTQRLDVTERLRRLRLYDTAWRELHWTKEDKYPPLVGRRLPFIDGNMLIFLNLDQSGHTSGYTSHRIPSTLRGVEEQRLDFATKLPSLKRIVDASQDLIISSGRSSYSSYHLRSLSSGDPHPLAHNNGVLDRTPERYGGVIIDIFEDLLLEVVMRVWGVEHIVWNWKTGVAEYKAVSLPSVLISSPTVYMIFPPEVEPPRGRYRARCFLDRNHLLVNAGGPNHDSKPVGIHILQFRTGPPPSRSRATSLTEGPTYVFLFPHFTPCLAFETTVAAPWRTVDPLSPVPFYCDPSDRIFSVRTAWRAYDQGHHLSFHILASTFHSYLRSHPFPRGSTWIDVPWDKWGPMGCRVTQRVPSITEACMRGTKILRIDHDPHHRSKPAVDILDYHPLRVARALMLLRSGATPVTVFRGSTLVEPGAAFDGFATMLPCISTNVPLPDELADAMLRGAQCQAYLCENGVVLMQVELRGQRIKDTWTYTI